MPTSASKAQICNLALSHIKQTRTLIANLETDTGTVANTLRTHYDVCREFVQSDHSWSFCTIRRTLADIGSPPSTWSYRYGYPSDCLHFWGIQNVTDDPNPLPFKVELTDDGSQNSILSNEYQAVGIFTKSVTNTSLFTPGFVSALSWYLASEIAPALSESDRIQEATLTVYNRMLGAAQRADNNQSYQTAAAASPWDQSRTGVSQPATVFNSA